MIVLAVLFGSTLVLRLAGLAGARALRTWRASARGGLAVMLVFTAVSHFAPGTRGDLVRMVPSGLGDAELWVTLTGLAELAGAVGLLVPATRRAAGICLVLLLVAMFPANVHAARESLEIAGRPATPLPLRAAMQVLFIGWTLWVSLERRPQPSRREGSADALDPTRARPVTRR